MKEKLLEGQRLINQSGESCAWLPNGDNLHGLSAYLVTCDKAYRKRTPPRDGAIAPFPLRSTQPFANFIGISCPAPVLLFFFFMRSSRY